MPSFQDCQQAESSRVDTGTGELVPVASVGGENDLIYKACGNRRAAVCPSCAETYRADAYQLVLAGLRGGKGIPDGVAGHAAIFATLTGPSFGAVHSRLVDAASGRVRACRPDRRHPVCPHGRLQSCGRQHAETDPRLGQPLCSDCYGYDAHAVWNAWARELWRRTTVALNRAVARHRPSEAPAARVSFGKVAEFQRRGVVHYHAILRLDGAGPEVRRVADRKRSCRRRPASAWVATAEGMRLRKPAKGVASVRRRSLMLGTFPPSCPATRRWIPNVTSDHDGCIR